MILHRYGGSLILLSALIVGVMANANVADAALTKLHDFVSGSDGEYPQSGLALDGNTLYGTTLGGANSSGNIWSYDTGSNSYTALYDFSPASDGAGPIGSIAFNSGTIYGATTFGGANSAGTIWSYDTGTTTFNNLHDFISGTDGYGPGGGATLSGSTLFGTTTFGGANSDGTIWSYDTGTSTFNKLHDFSGATDGHYVIGGVVVGGGVIYGTTFQGGANDEGTIWSYDTGTSTFTKLHDFSFISSGYNPRSSTLLVGNKLYGAALGGVNGTGTIWSYDLGTSTFNKLYDFDTSNDGLYPVGDLAWDSGTMYGVTFQGGQYGWGTAWSFDTNTSAFTTLNAFDFSPDGSQPSGGVVLDGSDIYGTAYGGGTTNHGTVWVISVPEPSSVVLAAFAIVGTLLTERRYKIHIKYRAARTQ